MPRQNIPSGLATNITNDTTNGFWLIAMELPGRFVEISSGKDRIFENREYLEGDLYSDLSFNSNDLGFMFGNIRLSNFKNEFATFADNPNLIRGNEIRVWYGNTDQTTVDGFVKEWFYGTFNKVNKVNDEFAEFSFAAKGMLVGNFPGFVFQKSWNNHMIRPGDSLTLASGQIFIAGA